MQMRNKLEALIDEMLDGQILLEKPSGNSKSSIYRKPCIVTSTFPKPLQSSASTAIRCPKRVSDYQKYDSSSNRAAKRAGWLDLEVLLTTDTPAVDKLLPAFYSWHSSTVSAKQVLGEALSSNKYLNFQG